ncbi:keratin, type II cytoskeletal 68 kDa, component IB-like [Amphibalanus amphitrite]|uniref:keratin, type II cytoskeletal 68 kDa, component IB-like n=1 Tax=Amphibalanus amphitrite TaxID=1232801 RepID=UPI001C8FF892|nr:keratin, type II cytoskeletal 68 kDa, component IB-like [Amphibalanus amphitrite]
MNFKLVVVLVAALVAIASADGGFRGSQFSGRQFNKGGRFNNFGRFNSGFNSGFGKGGNRFIGGGQRFNSGFNKFNSGFSSGFNSGYGGGRLHGSDIGSGSFNRFRSGGGYF